MDFLAEYIENYNKINYSLIVALIKCSEHNIVTMFIFFFVGSISIVFFDLYRIFFRFTGSAANKIADFNNFGEVRSRSFFQPLLRS